MAELLWDGKYKDGKKVPPLRVSLPFQTVETVNESAQERQQSLDLFSRGAESQWRNRLIWGDKKYVLPSLREEFAGQVELIYIDPPFNTGGDFSFSTPIPGTEEDLVYSPSAIEQKAYRDTWGLGLDSYLKWFYETAASLSELLSPTGSIYVHLDYHVSHYAKSILDDVFGSTNFQNEIIWKRTAARSGIQRWGTIHDTIFFYSKGTRPTWNAIYQPYEEKYLEDKYKYSDKRGAYRLDNLTAAGTSKGDSGKPWRGFDPTKLGRHWAVPVEALQKALEESEAGAKSTQEKLECLLGAGYIELPKKEDGFPQFKRYLGRGLPIQDVISDIPPVNSQALERVGYSTQKPEALLERIIEASSSPSGLVLDCFCGSGTTAAVAERLGRRWITSDLGRFAIHTTRKRLLGSESLKPFVVQNLGKYERQQWQNQEFGEDAEAKLWAYRKFILGLYGAEELSGKVWLHGVKGRRLVHVGSVDAPISIGDVSQIAKELKQLLGTGDNAPRAAAVDVLGWEFAFEINELAKQQAQSAGLDVRFIHIPREILEKNAVEQGDIKFFELAALSVAVTVKKRDLRIELCDFMMSLDDVPQDVRDAVQHWSQWVDYWAVDWDFKGDAFHNEWQSYRTRQNSKLQLFSEHVYEREGDFTVMVKVIDILGNDTTKTIKVTAK